MSELGDDITQAYDAVREDKEETNWMLLSYTGSVKQKNAKPALTRTGTGGLSELVEKLRDTEVQYGYVRIEYANDEESTRTKFVMITWIGDKAERMRRGSIFAETAAVKIALPHCHLAVRATDKSELEVDYLISLLKKSGGANYNGQQG